MKKQKKFYLSIFIFFLLILFLSPISGDDWGNYLVGRNGLYHSVGNAIGMYFSWEGRFISRILINILTYHKYMWNIINSLLVTSILFISIKLINPKHQKLIYLLTLLIILLMNIYTFSQTITWLAGNITYLFVIPLILIYFYIIIKKKEFKFQFPIFIILNVVMSMFVEHMAVVLVTGNMLILISNYKKEKKLDKKLLIYTIFSIFGLFLIILSPGNTKRSIIENTEFKKLSILNKVFYNIPNFIYYTFIINSYMLIILSMGNYLYIKNNIKNKYFKIILILFILIIPLLTVIIYPLSNFINLNINNLINQNNIFVIIYWILYLLLIVSFNLFDSRYKKDKIGLFLLTLGLIANLSMLMSPTWGYRTSLFTYIVVTISGLIMIDKYIKNDKYLEAFGYLINFCLILFYFTLYINVYRCQKDLVKNIKIQLKNDNQVIEVIKFPYFINCNINPEDEFHIKKFKEYYKIPKEKQLKFIEGKWKYLILYNK